MTDTSKREVKRPGGAWREDRQGGFSATASEIVPFFFTDANTLRKKAFLGPAAAVMVLFVLLGHYLDQLQNANSFAPAVNFVNVLVSFCALAAMYLIYQMCGHRKPWWWLGSAGLFIGATMLLALRHIDVVRFFEPNALSIGLFEELWKALPVFLALGIGRRLSSPRREKLGVWEPLDGILLGVAAATAFGLVENLTAYGPEGDIHKVMTYLSEHPELKNLTDSYVTATVLTNLMKEILRSVDFLFGHLAWSGLFGYFIGMAAMRPRSAPKLLAIGYLTAAGLHALWDEGVVALQIVVGLASYSALALAILKARKISPNRKDNFASTTVAATKIRIAAPEVAPMEADPPRVDPVEVTPIDLGPALVIAGKRFPIQAGLMLLENDVPGLKPAGADRVVAEFNANPNDPRMVGLKNLSSTTWIRTTASGEERAVEPGKSVHLAAGSTINFGSSTDNFGSSAGSSTEGKVG